MATYILCSIAIQYTIQQLDERQRSHRDEQCTLDKACIQGRELHGIWTPPRNF